jgi:hypothetical protein
VAAQLSVKQLARVRFPLSPQLLNMCMIEHMPLVYLDYPLDKARLLQDSIDAQKVSIPYQDPRYPEYQFDYWAISRYTSEYIQQIMQDFEVNGKPRFYWLKENSKLPEHVDNGTTCSINFVLSNNLSPVTFGDNDYMYSMALLNTSIPHSVTNGDTERLLFKISIDTESFEELAARIKYKAKSEQLANTKI